MTYDSIAAWLVWVIPLIACLFVPVVAKKGDKIRNYYVIAIAVLTAALAFSLVPGVWSGNGQPQITRLIGFQASVTSTPEYTSTRCRCCLPV